jgi:hypothetical protein
MKVRVETLNSAGIVSEARNLGLEEIEFIGAFDPVEPLFNVCEADAKIRVYSFPGLAYVADTNGDPVWEANDPQAWADLMEQYGVEL